MEWNTKTNDLNLFLIYKTKTVESKRESPV